MNTGLKAFFPATLIILLLSSQAVGRGGGGFRGGEHESFGRGDERDEFRGDEGESRRGGEGEYRRGDEGEYRRGGEGEYRPGGAGGFFGRGGEGGMNRPSEKPSRPNAFDRPYPSFNPGEGGHTGPAPEPPAPHPGPGLHPARIRPRVRALVPSRTRGCIPLRIRPQGRGLVPIRTRGRRIPPRIRTQGRVRVRAPTRIGITGTGPITGITAGTMARVHGARASHRGSPPPRLGLGATGRTTTRTALLPWSLTTRPSITRNRLCWPRPRHGRSIGVPAGRSAGVRPAAGARGSGDGTARCRPGDVCPGRLRRRADQVQPGHRPAAQQCGGA